MTLVRRRTQPDDLTLIFASLSSNNGGQVLIQSPQHDKETLRRAIYDTATSVPTSPLDSNSDLIRVGGAIKKVNPPRRVVPAPQPHIMKAEFVNIFTSSLEYQDRPAPRRRPPTGKKRKKQIPIPIKLRVTHYHPLLPLLQGLIKKV